MTHFCLLGGIHITQDSRDQVFGLASLEGRPIEVLGGASAGYLVVCCYHVDCQRFQPENLWKECIWNRFVEDSLRELISGRSRKLPAPIRCVTCSDVWQVPSLSPTPRIPYWWWSSALHSAAHPGCVALRTQIGVQCWVWWYHQGDWFCLIPQHPQSSFPWV